MTEIAQSYAQHTYRPTATFIASAFVLVSLIAAGGAAIFGWNSRDIALISVVLAVAVLVAISRTYIVRLQDRIIMLEMKVRCAEVLPAGQDALLAELTPKQIVALRFASDDELGALLQRAVREKLSPDQIKQSVQRWRPDYHRT
jgi:hypothetical protein